MADAMKLYKARNGNYDRAGKTLYVFIVAKADEQAELLAKQAFSQHLGIPGLYEEYIRMHVIIEDLSQPTTSAVWGLLSDD